jgi:agmatine deiminase
MKNTLLLSLFTFLSLTICAQEQETDEGNENVDATIKTTNSIKRKVAKNSDVLFTLTKDTELHDATWLQWPHSYQYGVIFAKRLDFIWVDIAAALVSSEKVNIIVYDEIEKSKVVDYLKNAGISLTNITFKIHPTDDCWIRDNGPIYTRDKNGNLNIGDWGFNGWGKKSKYTLDDAIPTKIGNETGIPISDYNATLTLESGSIQMDPNGTVLATKSSILNNNRNSGKSQLEIEKILKKHIGAGKFIWLKGTSGVDNTDFHIDNFARFINDTTIVSMSNEDLAEWQVPESDIETLNNATNDIGIAYNFIKLPLTKKNVTTAYGKNIGYKATYLGYYVANTVVLVPNYSDENDTVANEIIQKIYPDKKIIGIDIRNLYALGATLRNVVKEQPKKLLVY